MRRLLAVAALLALAPPWAAVRAQGTAECALVRTSLPDAIEGVPYDAPLLLPNSPVPGFSGSNLPPGLAVVDAHVKGTPTTPGSYNIGLTYADRCGKPVKEKETNIDAGPPNTVAHRVVPLKVKDAHAPTIGSFSVTPNNLGTTGGSVTLAVKATDNVGVTRVMMTTTHPDGHSGSAFVTMTSGTAANGTWSITFALGANTATAPATYSFAIAVGDQDGNTAKAGPNTVVIAARGAQQVPLMPPKRP